MGWRRTRYGMIAGFLLLVGVIVPAVFGLLTEKAMEIGTADLLDKSTNWDDTNIANSTYFVRETAYLWDNETGQKYAEDLVYDSDNELDLAMADKSNVVSSISVPRDVFEFNVYLNKTAFDDVDKLVIVFKVLDAATADLNKTLLRMRLIGDDWNEPIFGEARYNVTNSTMRVEITIDAIKRLKINSQTTDQLRLFFALEGNGEQVQLDNVVAGYRVELYDVKKVNASAAANTMLVASGILAWVGALAATPYWNPMKNPAHRDVRRVGRGVRRVSRRFKRRR